MNKEKIAKICWNDNGWTKPSGLYGKSKDKNTYERQNGFGFEEWLFDISKIIDGYHYSFLQPVKRGWKTHQNKDYNILLYAYNSKTKEYWRIGKINNVKIITEDESVKIKKEYKERGWVNEMRSQLKEIDIIKPSQFNPDFCIKYKISDLKLPEKRLKILNPKKIIKATRYVLLNNNDKIDIEPNINKKFVFKSGHDKRKGQTTGKHTDQSFEIESLHIKMTNNIYHQLTKQYGKDKVRTEQPTGCGTNIDICVKDGDSYIFYELKTVPIIKRCIREALGQLVEYSYFPDRYIAKKLVIVSPNPVDDNTICYMKHLRKKLKMPVYYQYYDNGRKILTEKEY